MGMLIVTDLDGTLLDHSTYSYEPARPALAAIRAAQVPLVLATSKTAAEVAPLHAELGLRHMSAIVENGAGLYRHGQVAADADDYDRLRASLDALAPELRRAFKGFGDMGDAEVANVTGLDPASAGRARRRSHSEPGLWQGDQDGLARFQNALAAQGIQAKRGGRFLTLSFGRSKADAMLDLRRELRADRVIALGDAPNDIEMLEAADIGVILPNAHGTAIPILAGEADGRIRRATREGPSGWNDAVLGILHEMETIT